ncbi:MAG: hypothetical protein V1493_05900 [Candidatus Diapherotrites archaeon]
MGYRQKHFETCLAKCLMILAEREKGIRLTDKYELEMLVFAMDYDRENFVVGHLAKACKDFGLKLDWIAGSKILFDFAKKRKMPKAVSFSCHKIDLKFIDSALDRPAIVFLDQFQLWQKSMGLYHKCHWPHFVVVEKKTRGSYEIIDPSTGKKREISKKLLSKAISSLRNHLWLSPQIIRISK